MTRSDPLWWHTPRTENVTDIDGEMEWTICDSCYQDWPCPTILKAGGGRIPVELSDPKGTLKALPSSSGK